MIEFNEKLRRLRRNKKLTQEQLANILQVSSGTIAMWETAKREPDFTMVQKIATFFDVSIDYLLGHNDDVGKAVISHNVVKIPVYGTIPAGVPTEMIDETYIEDYEEIDAIWLRGGNQYFGLIVKGDSMYPEFRSGDVLIIKKSPDCESGDYCAVSINCTECTFKKVIKEQNGIVLQPLNSAYTPQFFSNEQIETLPITILGKVVEVRRTYGK